ncbi:Ig-like domain-containing protein [Thioalkalivibrio nitratireducens]|uniref:Ig-like domain-containing protein n=1 Tax=Thioalkalivibrio nitratireducens TaxID=186931 RepID=UPI0005C1A057|nr:Ig-like domain-containing protein [Thioalkalivibrio nitratireducens]
MGQLVDWEGHPDLTVVIRSPDGTPLAEGDVDDQGQFHLEWDEAFTGGETLMLALHDADGAVLDQLEIQAPDIDPAERPNPPENVEVSDDGTVVTGEGEAGLVAVVRNPDGQIVGEAQVRGDGTFRVLLDQAFTDGEQLEVRLRDDDTGLESDAVFVDAPTDVDPPDDRPAPPEDLAINDEGTMVTGKGTPGLTAVVRDPQGNIVGNALVNPDGTFEVHLAQPFVEGERLEVRIVNDAGVESLPGIVFAPDLTDEGPDAPIITQADFEGVGGTAEVGTTVHLNDADGHPLLDDQGAPIVASVDASGNWFVPASDFPGGSSVGVEGQATARDAQGRESDPADFAVPSLFAFDNSASAGIQIQPAFETQELDDLEVSNVLFLLGTDSDELEFTVPEGSVGALSFGAQSASLLQVLGNDLHVELQRKDEFGNFVKVGEWDGDPFLLGLDLLGLFGTSGSVAESGLPPGEYKLVLSQSSVLSLLSSASLTDVQLFLVNPDEFDVVGVSPITGNVITDPGDQGRPDIPGHADTSISILTESGIFVVVGPEGRTVQGEYGSLFIDASGNYRYEPNPDAQGIGQTDTFTYKLTHPNGDTAEATLTITIEAEEVPIQPMDTQADGDAVVLAAMEDSSVDEASEGGSEADEESLPEMQALMDEDPGPDTTPMGDEASGSAAGEPAPSGAESDPMTVEYHDEGPPPGTADDMDQNHLSMV